MECSLIVVSTTRTKDNDGVEKELTPLLHKISTKFKASIIVKDEIQAIQNAVKERIALDDHLIIVSGGTGITSDDLTPDALVPLYTRTLPGFDEAMRMSSFKITPHALISRGVSGIINQTIVISLPGSPKAARENLDVILPALPHAVAKLRGDRGPCA